MEEQLKREINGDKKSLSSTVEYYTGKKEFVLVREVEGARKILYETGQGEDFGRVAIQCVVFTAVGALIGFAIQSIIAVAILGLMGFMIPIWNLKLYSNRHKKYLAVQLENATSMISMSYIRSNNFILAVEENLDQINPLIRPNFQKFVDETKINASVKNCVRNLRDSINDALFHEWCEVVLKTLDNSEMKEALLPICTKYTNVKIVQDEIDEGTHAAIVEYVIMMLFVVCMYPLVWFLNKDWFAYYGTFPGKIVIAWSLIVLFFCIIRLITLLTPVDYEKETKKK